MRWQPGTGPGARRRRTMNRFKRGLIALATRDVRLRRLAINYLFTRYLAPGTLCCIPFQDHTIFVDPRDDRIAYTLLTGRPWHRGDLDATIALARAHDRLPDGGVFVDVGANIGTMTLYALLSGTFDRAVAVEPDPGNLDILRRNLEVNGLTEKVTVIAAAASSAPGQMTLHRDAKNLGAHSLEPGFIMTPGETRNVRVDTLDNLIAEAGLAEDNVSFVKIDVEGHEHEVLQGMAALLMAGPVVMLEATFDVSNSDAASSDWSSVISPFSDRYRTCANVAQRDPGTGLPVTETLDRFRPTAIQHDLVIL